MTTPPTRCTWATDFGVLAGPNNGQSGWHTMKGMPRYEVMHLEIQPSSRVPTCMDGGKCKRVLYAATHSQGIWSLDLGPGQRRRRLAASTTSEAPTRAACGRPSSLDSGG